MSAVYCRIIFGMWQTAIRAGKLPHRIIIVTREVVIKFRLINDAYGITILSNLARHISEYERRASRMNCERWLALPPQNGIYDCEWSRLAAKGRGALGRYYSVIWKM